MPPEERTLMDDCAVPPVAVAPDGTDAALSPEGVTAASGQATPLDRPPDPDDDRDHGQPSLFGGLR